MLEHAVTNLTAIIVAIIAAIATVTGAVLPILSGLRKARAENGAQHKTVETGLANVEGKVDGLTDSVMALVKRFDRHLEDHAPKRDKEPA